VSHITVPAAKVIEAAESVLARIMVTPLSLMQRMLMYFGVK
jgi:hypothetical protein